MALFAARGRAIAALIDGDPIAWTILGVVVAVMIIIAVVRYKLSQPSEKE